MVNLELSNSRDSRNLVYENYGYGCACKVRRKGQRNGMHSNLIGKPNLVINYAKLMVSRKPKKVALIIFGKLMQRLFQSLVKLVWLIFSLF